MTERRRNGSRASGLERWTSTTGTPLALMASRMAIDVWVYAPALSTTPAKPSSRAAPIQLTRSPSWLDCRHTASAPGGARRRPRTCWWISASVVVP